MFWKRFRSAQSAGKLFNQANEQWRRRQRFMVEGDEESERDACAEVIRLCQLSIQTDERMGDAYVLLANTLAVAASHGPRRSDQERYEFLQSRAAAVIHLWYTLPHRGYPITKKTGTEIGERLWRIMVEEISQDKSLSEDATMALIESYRDNLAADTISPDSFKEIQEIISRTASTPEPNQSELRESLEEVLLSPETWYFLAEILPAVQKGQSYKQQVTTDRLSHIRAELDKLRDHPRIFHASMELLEREKQAHHNNDFRQAIGWLTWLFVLELYREGITPDSDSKEEDVAKHWKELVEMLRITINEARQAEDWDALVLAAGFYEWLDISVVSDEVLRVLYEEIGKEAVAGRLSEILRQPRAVAEMLLARHLQQHLGKS